MTRFAVLRAPILSGEASSSPDVRYTAAESART
jgi:hypothetical protein